MSRQPPPSPPRSDKPDPDFLETLQECADEALALRDKIATLMHQAPKDPAAWFGTFTDPAVCKGLGALMMTTGKSAAWVNQAVTQAVGVLNTALPAESSTVTEHFVQGQVDAEVSCTCGDCVPCAFRNENGIQATRDHLTAQLRPETKKQHSRLVDPRGRPLH